MKDRMSQKIELMCLCALTFTLNLSFRCVGMIQQLLPVGHYSEFQSQLLSLPSKSVHACPPLRIRGLCVSLSDGSSLFLQSNRQS